MDLFDKCKVELVDRAREAKIYPYFHELESRQAPEVIMEGKRKIMLGSNNYLGLTSNPRVIEAGIHALEKYGSGCSGSRFLNGTLDLHVQLESELADFLGKDSVMTFSTGFQTNLGVISAIAGRSDYIFCDKDNHASIYDGCKLSYAKTIRFNHSDMDHLESALKSVPIESGKLIVSDGVFSMGGDICKLPEIVALAEKYNARVMIDDAHGLGVIGNGGRGTADYFGLTDKVDLITGTFSKSLASLGGFVAGNHKVIDFIRHTSRPFIFCASLPPASCATAIESLHILKEHPEMSAHLLKLAEYMRNGLRKRDIRIRDSITPIIPIYTYEEMRTLCKAKELFDAGVYVNPVLPPAAPPAECLLRTSYMATLTSDLLDEAIDIIESVLKHD